MQENADRLKSAHKKSIFGTEDGQYFFEKHAAVAHNKFLKQNDAEWSGEIIDFEDKPVEAVEKPAVHRQPPATPKAPKVPAAPKAPKAPKDAKAIPVKEEPNAQPIENPTGNEPQK